MPVAIVAIPEAQDRVHKISSEKVPHLTMMYLGEDVPANSLARIVLFVEHVASQVPRFGLSVDRRGELGDKKADVLFFEKEYYTKELKEVVASLLSNRDIHEAYNSTTQFPEWIPHLTLGYPESPAKQVDDDYGVHYVQFDRIAVWTGDYDGPEFVLQREKNGLEVGWSAEHRIAGEAALTGVLSHMRGSGDFDEAKVKRDGKGRFSNVSSKKVKALNDLSEKQRQALLDKYGEALFESSSMEDYLANLPKGQDPEGTRLELEVDLRTMEAEFAATSAGLGAQYIGPEYDPKKRYKAKSTTDFGHSMPLDGVVAAIQEVSEDDAEHFGVKGMKWGVRNASSASDAKTMVERGVAAGGYIVKGGYTSGTVTRAKNSGDLKKLSDSPRFKGKDIRADKTLQKEYRRAVEKIFQKYETRGSRAWRHFETTTDAMYLVALPVRVLTHDAVDPIEIEMVGLNLDAEGHVTTFRSDIIEHANEDGITFFVEVDDVDALQFGIKGMKWGVRRSEKQLEAARANADPDAIKAVETQAKISAAGSLNVVSSKDLQQLVSRIELEKKYIKATLESSPTTKKGSSLISKAIGLLGREVAMKAEGKDGPLLTGYKALKVAREKKTSSALKAAQAAKAAKDERDRLRKVQKEREKQAAYNSPSNRNRHPGPRVSTDSPADRRTARAERVYNVTTLNTQGNPLALPRGRN